MFTLFIFRWWCSTLITQYNQTKDILEKDFEYMKHALVPCTGFCILFGYIVRGISLNRCSEMYWVFETRYMNVKSYLILFNNVFLWHHLLGLFLCHYVYQSICFLRIVIDRNIFVLIFEFKSYFHINTKIWLNLHRLQQKNWKELLAISQ